MAVHVLSLLLLSCCACVQLERPPWRLQWPLLTVAQSWGTEKRSHTLSSTLCKPHCLTQASQSSYSNLSPLLSYQTPHSNDSLRRMAAGIHKLDSAPLSGSYPWYVLVPGLSRAKRQIYGLDGRFSILGRGFLMRFPFSAAVKVSSGCSGTLVGPRHVLTAAHCVHDGQGYVKGTHKLRVGLLKPWQTTTPHTQGSTAIGKFQWIRVKHIHVPKGWVTADSSEGDVAYDYALLELKRPHKRRYMQLGVAPPSHWLPGRRLQFSGFDDDREGQLVFRFCYAHEETADLVYQHCDAQPGASGSGVYVRLWQHSQQRWERRVIAVFSGHQWLDRNGAPQEFNVAVRITPLKYAQICYWIKGSYGDCREG
ncbi:hypothetical protein JZ751_029143 [Albula glossodonta]|uniref:Serine protease 23 n=1 Tax=Albula glossodonta TaxID=121402 RepID=A0A8T2PAS8_9TELE|nr:hypothetical protein JZ751_029143 [Albula glossodonta]